MKSASSPAILFYVVLIYFLCPASVHAGPPLLTDDPDTPGPNLWEINVSTLSANFDHEWEYGPLLDMNYGVGDHIQLKYQVQENVIAQEGNGTRAGLGNSLAGIKWRFLDQTNGSWLEISTYPQVEFIYPTSSIQRVQADSGDNLLLPFEFEHTYKSLIVYGEIGYVWNEFRPASVFGGLAAEYEVTERFAVMAEFYGGFDREFLNDGMSFNVGFRKTLTGHVSLIASAGRGIFGPAERAPEFQSYLGLEFNF